jgi:hypothetical protein
VIPLCNNYCSLLGLVISVSQHLFIENHCKVLTIEKKNNAKLIQQITFQIFVEKEFQFFGSPKKVINIFLIATPSVMGDKTYFMRKI